MNMKKTAILLLTILFLSACSGPAADKENTGAAGSGKVEEKTMDEKKTPFAKRFLEEINHTDLAAEYKYAVIKTNQGDIKVEFYADESPITVNNFLNLAKNDFYNGVKFHRVIKDFMIQGGDPNSKDDDSENVGRGGPGYKFADEINAIPLVRGSLAMANSGPNTNGSQFFIVTAEAVPHLDGRHTNFGRVVAGMDVVEKIENVDTDRSTSENPNDPYTNFNDRPFKEMIIESIELVQE